MYGMVGTTVTKHKIDFHCVNVNTVLCVIHHFTQTQCKQNYMYTYIHTYMHISQNYDYYGV